MVFECKDNDGYQRWREDFNKKQEKVPVVLSLLKELDTDRDMMQHKEFVNSDYHREMCEIDLELENTGMTFECSDEKG